MINVNRDYVHECKGGRKIFIMSHNHVKTAATGKRLMVSMLINILIPAA